MFFHCVDLPYELVGNANLTNAFGQSIALMTLAIVATSAVQLRRIGPQIGIFLIASLAFLSHISTAAQLGVTLLTLAVFYRLLGDSGLRSSAVATLVVTILTAAFSWVAYYGHFTDVYATALQRVRAPSQVVTAPQGEPTQATSEAGNRRRAETSFSSRTRAALGMTARSIGLPIVLLALAGLWPLWTNGARDRLGLLLAAWGATYLVFLGVGIVPRVGASFERYAAEFVGRVVFATYPAAVILAARGAAWGLRAGLATRLVAVVCLLWVIADGVRYWRNWFE